MKTVKMQALGNFRQKTTMHKFKVVDAQFQNKVITFEELRSRDIYLW